MVKPSRELAGFEVDCEKACGRGDSSSRCTDRDVPKGFSFLENENWQAIARRLYLHSRSICFEHEDATPT